MYVYVDRGNFSNMLTRLIRDYESKARRSVEINYYEYMK